MRHTPRNRRRQRQRQLAPDAGAQAALGASVEFRSLDKTISARVPAGTSSGQTIRMRGQGFPARSGRGDLFVKTQITVPLILTPEEKELYRKLGEASSEAQKGGT